MKILISCLFQYFQGDMEVFFFKQCWACALINCKSSHCRGSWFQSRASSQGNYPFRSFLCGRCLFVLTAWLAGGSQTHQTIAHPFLTLCFSPVSPHKQRLITIPLNPVLWNICSGRRSWVVPGVNVYPQESVPALLWEISPMLSTS